MFRWLYPKDRDYSFTLWDLFVSLTLLAVYVAGFRLLLVTSHWRSTLGRVQRLSYGTHHSQFENRHTFDSRQPQQLYVLIYQLESKTQQQAVYKRTVLPLQTAGSGFLYYSNILNLALNSEHNEIGINGQSLAIDLRYPVGSKTANIRTIGDTGGGFSASPNFFVFSAIDGTDSRYSGNNYIQRRDTLCILWVDEQARVEKAPQEILLPTSP